MKTIDKKSELKKNKWVATGLLIFMASIFIGTTIWLKYAKDGIFWIGGLRAFSEAAMVGALADWFAVTALFRYPLGVKLPHTNLIESSKARIGDNLGTFVVDNFLTSENIKYYTQKVSLSDIIGKWLIVSKNQDFLIQEIYHLLINTLKKNDDKTAITFIENKIREATNSFEINILVGNIMEYILKKKEHQKLVTYIASEAKVFVDNNRKMIKDKVSEKSFFLVPDIINDEIATQLTRGILEFFSDVEKNINHPLRNDITQKLNIFIEDIRTENHWKVKFENLKTEFLKEDRVEKYANDIWIMIKNNIEKEMNSDNSSIRQYIKKNLDDFAINLIENKELQNKIDVWSREAMEEYILKNVHQVGEMISNTVGNWDGKELSDKLELEVGKDLQYIRISGTLVGGIVGLLIYIIVHILM